MKFFFIKKNAEFYKIILLLGSSSFFAQLITFLGSMFLARIYSVNGFGLYALFVSIASILSVIVSGKYELAILLPKYDKDAQQIMFLCFCFCAFVFVLLFVVFLVFFFTKILIFPDMRWQILLLMVFYVILTKINEIFILWLNRKKEYKIIAKSNLIQSIVTIISQCIFGLLYNNELGLVIGSFIGIVTTFFYLYSLIKFDIVNVAKIHYMKKKYINFLKYNVAASVLNQACGNIIVIMLPFLFDANILGYYYMANKIINVLLNIFISPIRYIFNQEAPIEKNNTGKAINSFNFIFRKIFVVSCLICLTLFFFGKEIIFFTFGEKWNMSGDFLMILIPLAFIQFIVNPLSLSFGIFQKNRLDLLWQIFFICSSFFPFIVVYFFKIDFKYFMLLYIYAMVFAYSINLLLSYKICKGEL